MVLVDLSFLYITHHKFPSLTSVFWASLHNSEFSGSFITKERVSARHMEVSPKTLLSSSPTLLQVLKEGLPPRQQWFKQPTEHKSFRRCWLIDVRECLWRPDQATNPKTQHHNQTGVKLGLKHPFQSWKKMQQKERLNSHKNIVWETWREDNFFYLYSGKNHSYKSYFAVNETIEIDSRGSGDTKLESLYLPIKFPRLKHLALEITVCIFIWN